MFERFTENGRQAVVHAQREARELRHDHIGTEHLLLGLVAEEEGTAAVVLAAAKVQLDTVRAEVVRRVGEGTERPSGQIPFTPRAKKLFESALRESLRLGHPYVGTEHLLLAIAGASDDIAGEILAGLGLNGQSIRELVLAGIKQRPPARSTPRPTPAHRPAPLRPLMAALAEARQRLIEADRFDEAARVRDAQRQLAEAVDYALEQLKTYGPEPPSIGRAATTIWEYKVVPLAGDPSKWPKQLEALREEGWDLITVVSEHEGHQAILERIL